MACSEAGSEAATPTPGATPPASPTASGAGEATAYDGIAESDTVRFTGTEPFWGGEIARSEARYSTPEKLEATRKSIPLQRLGTARDCAPAYLFLASGALSGYITGQVLEVNGGQLIC